MDVYLLSGLGADERLFQYLDLSAYNVTPVKWVTPSGDERIEDYCTRLLPQIISKNAVLIGVSFGGMLSIEIGKQMAVDKIILISSVATENEVPASYRVGRRIKLYRFIPGNLLKHTHVFINWVMGAKDPVRRKLLGDMLKDSDPRFLSWAIDKVITWTNKTELPNVIRIHGTNDKVLPMTKVDFVIEGGTHIMVASRAKEIDAVLRTILKS